LKRNSAIPIAVNFGVQRRHLTLWVRRDIKEDPITALEADG
jgi:hypothetical protein